MKDLKNNLDVYSKLADKVGGGVDPEEFVKTYEYVHYSRKWRHNFVRFTKGL